MKRRNLLERGKRMELETVVKLIGCLVVAVLIFVIPCLATLAWALNWDAFLKYLFTMLSICVIVTKTAVLYGSVD